MIRKKGKNKTDNTLLEGELKAPLMAFIYLKGFCVDQKYVQHIK